MKHRGIKARVIVVMMFILFFQNVHRFSFDNCSYSSASDCSDPRDSHFFLLVSHYLVAALKLALAVHVAPSPLLTASCLDGILPHSPVACSLCFIKSTVNIFIQYYLTCFFFFSSDVLHSCVDLESGILSAFISKYWVA